MFLISHFFRSDAVQVFFSTNRSVVSAFKAHFSHNSHIDKTPLENHDQAPIELGPFLRHVVPQEALPHLRRIDAVFAPFDPTYLIPGSTTDIHLSKDLAYAIPWLNIRALTIILSLT
jgi:hypothetical protein